MYVFSVTFSRKGSNKKETFDKKGKIIHFGLFFSVLTLTLQLPRSRMNFFNKCKKSIYFLSLCPSYGEAHFLKYID